MVCFVSFVDHKAPGAVVAGLLASRWDDLGDVAGDPQPFASWRLCVKNSG